MYICTPAWTYPAAEVRIGRIKEDGTLIGPFRIDHWPRCPEIAPGGMSGQQEVLGRVICGRVGIGRLKRVFGAKNAQFCDWVKHYTATT